MRVFLTGFAAFPGMPHNPSEKVARDLAARHWSQIDEMSACTLITSYGCVDAMAWAFIKGFAPRLCVHFGVDARATTLRVEQRAANILNPRLIDQDGRLPQSRLIDEGSPRHLYSRVNSGRLAGNLTQRGLPIDASSDAGAYLCNYLYYRSLQWSLKDQPRDVVFIHLPYPDDWRPLSNRDARRGHNLTYRQILASAQKTIHTLISTVSR